ncbi:hypothetical protein [Hoeflea ulvae]|uniref:Uncharacterized protein n=1 Tax=Hoeflea ulvae TaxID=2983764 RepID=A0ABT3YLZ9_9HYPH|nr:hypothetical protein [Hoeflea ulvae]MCY0096939.1 hypothetical protein [Hoeflea ulvae]
MMRNILSATTIVLFTGVSAIAQTSTDATGAASGSMSWDQTTRDAFFGDGATLRSDSELRSGWNSLDTAQQAKVRADCEAMQTSGSAATSTEGTTGTDTAADSSSSSSDSSTSGTASTGTDSSATAGASATSDAAMPDMASMTQLCDQIKTY